MRHVLSRKKATQPQNPLEKQQTIRRELAWAAGCGYRSSQNLLSHVTENFLQTFDEIGRRHAAAMVGEPVQREDTLSINREQTALDEDPESAASGLRTPTESPQTQRSTGQENLRRFSEIAFQRGTLAGAVLAGTGRVMLVSCLKRAAGQSQSAKEQQRRLFAGGAQERYMPGQTAETAVVWNPGFADSAVGLVVDTLNDARGMVESLAELAAKGEVEKDGVNTIRKMYPFLDDSRERQLSEKYAARLQESTDPDERNLLQNALVHTDALIQKKAQTRDELINKLRLMADRSTEALSLFTAEGFVEDVTREVYDIDEQSEPPEPPEKPDNEDNTDDDEQTGGTETDVSAAEGTESSA